MRYPPGHRQQTRQRLLDRAAVLMKKNGYAATGVDALMQAAGLTGGALYAHFDSKQALLRAVVIQELAHSLVRLQGDAGLPAAQALNQVLDDYLSPAHVQDLAQGCILPALAAELGRAEAAVQQRVAAAHAQFLQHWQARLGYPLPPAWLATCVGAVLMARCLPEGEAQTAVLASARALLAVSGVNPLNRPEPAELPWSVLLEALPPGH